MIYLGDKKFFIEMTQIVTVLGNQFSKVRDAMNGQNYQENFLWFKNPSIKLPLYVFCNQNILYFYKRS